MIVYETGITTVYSLISSIEKFLDNRTGITLLWISKKPVNKF